MFVMFYGKKKIKIEDFFIIYFIEFVGWSVVYCVKFYRDKYIILWLVGIICFVKEGWIFIMFIFFLFLWFYII